MVDWDFRLCYNKSKLGALRQCAVQKGGVNLSSNVEFLIFYVLKFVAMVAVVALAIFIGVSLRKLYDKKKAAKTDESKAIDETDLSEVK